MRDVFIVIDPALAFYGRSIKIARHLRTVEKNDGAGVVNDHKNF